MYIKLIPNDPLFFRSGRPFTMGDDTWADEIFPPYPSTIYGAIRSFLIFHRGSLNDFYHNGYNDIGNKNNKGSLKLYGPFILSEKNTPYFPAPYDLVKKKGEQEKEEKDKEKQKNEKKDNNHYPLTMIDTPAVFYSDKICQHKILVSKSTEPVDEPEGWMDDIEFKEYLTPKEDHTLKKDRFYFINRKDIFDKEPKIGIAREDKTLSSKEGYLYRIDQVRMAKNYGLLVKLEGVNGFPEKGILQLGGEGRTAVFEKLDENPLESLQNLEISSHDNIFKLYLATPAIFDKGWLPNWIDENTLEGVFNNIKVKLLACAIGKYIRIGGWDMAKNKPKPMYKAVPAGSVYYFQLSENNFENVKNIFHFKCISDKKPEEGFGLCFVGAVK